MAADPQPQKKRRSSTCVGCGSQITDQYILRVSPDLEWHAACLKCADCHQYLDETCTCFVRDGKTYCRRDYLRLFGIKCARCSVCLSKSDFVMRARSQIYHIDCFRCVACARQLLPGDEFSLREDGNLCCKAEHCVSTLTDKKPPHNGHPPNGHTTPNGALQMAGNPANAETGLSQSGRGRDSVGRPQVHSKQGSDHKPTRVRTVLNEKQLHTLRTCYAANPRPDALMKEQLVEMTGLSPRVIRVWFQNKRCKDKKKSIMMKQLQQQEKDGRQLSLGSMRGVPMVATSPVRHESPLQVHPIEVQTYQPPWKALTEYALQPEIDPQAPHFQQIVSQMHGYGDPASDHHVLPPGVHTSHPLAYLSDDHSLHQPPSDLSSSHIPGTPSELSSPTSE